MNKIFTALDTADAALSAAVVAHNAGQDDMVMDAAIKVNEALCAARDAALGLPVGYTCTGCRTHHVFTVPSTAWHDGVHHTCTRCGQVTELHAGNNLGKVKTGEAA